MRERLNPQEVALLIRARQILKAKGLAKDADVKNICEAAGISRKTGYQWANNLDLYRDEKDHVVVEELARVKEEHEDLKARHRRLEIENEGRKLSWEIHGVDELLAAKKNTTRQGKKKKR
jgi:DNA polymerase/3'-5' exonuclease PolX